LISTIYAHRHFSFELDEIIKIAFFAVNRIVGNLFNGAAACSPFRLHILKTREACLVV